MAVYQILVKHLDGRTHCLQIPGPTVSGDHLKRILSHRTLIPAPLLRLVSGRHEISSETLVSAADDGLFPSCALLLRLPGGKGGFGSLLRGAATKAGQKKTSNFDACRDMSGRRLRHVNAEKRLEEWRNEAEDRKLEKIAEAFIRKKEKEEKKKRTGGDVDKFLEKYREESAMCMEKVQESVRESFALYKDSKRKVLPMAGTDPKRLKIWLGKKKMVDSESESDEDDDDVEKDSNENSVVLDAVTLEVTTMKTEDSSSPATAVHSDSEKDGESLSCISNHSSLEKENGVTIKRGCNEMDLAWESLEQSSDSDGTVEPDTIISDKTSDNGPATAVSISQPIMDFEESKPPMEGQLEDNVETGLPQGSEFAAASPKHSDGSFGKLAAHCGDAPTSEGPLDFKKYMSASELEVIGMEKLKTELQARGLKCGGTLQERAGRLFLLKTTPLEKLPKKVFAVKPLSQGK